MTLPSPGFPGRVEATAYLPREVIAPLVWMFSVVYLRERKVLIGCWLLCSLLIDVKHPYNSDFLFNAFCRQGTELGFMISILQMMKLILRNISKCLSWRTIPCSPDSEVHVFSISFLDMLLSKGLRFLISLSQRDRCAHF